MRLLRLLPCVLVVVGCGDNLTVPATPDGAPDSPVDAGSDAADAPVDMPSGGPLNLTDLTPAGGSVVQRADFGTPLFFRPDSTAVAVVANYNSANMVSSRFDPYVVQLDGSGVRRLFDAGTSACSTCDAELLAWTADGTQLFATGDLQTNADAKLYALDPTMTDQAATLAIEVPASGDIINLLAVASGGGATRVWAVGDFLTDAKREAGGFDSAATLPFSTATPPPIVVPGGSPALFSGSGTTDNVFDARGDKIAFVADTTTAGRFDLVVADADGSNPVTLVTGSNGIEITSVALSPDGTKVGFLMDGAEANNAYDLYFVTTDGTGTPVRVSPDRPGSASNLAVLNVFFQFEWSSDSKFIAFSGDLTEDQFDQGYVVDTTAGTPTAVELLSRAEITATTGTRGIRAKLLFDPANNIYFRARIAVGSTNFTFFKATTAGTKAEIEIPLRSDSTTADVGAFGITPDGQTLVFSADTPTGNVYNLFAQPI